MSRRSIAAAAVVSGLLVIAGCSPHPGSGSWIPQAHNEGDFSRLLVQFDGKAELYRAGVEHAVYRCFWAGDGKKTLLMRCATASNPDIEVRYRLEIAGDGSAGLYQSGRLVTRFGKDPEGDADASGK